MDLKGICFTWNGEEEITITPVQFQRLRAILAYQNGIELTDEDANPDLLEAEAELARRNGPKLRRDRPVCFPPSPCLQDVRKQRWTNGPC